MIKIRFLMKMTWKKMRKIQTVKVTFIKKIKNNKNYIYFLLLFFFCYEEYISLMIK